MQGVWVRSLVGELRSHMHHSQKKKKKSKHKQYCNKFNKDLKKSLSIKKKESRESGIGFPQFKAQLLITIGATSDK